MNLRFATYTEISSTKIHNMRLMRLLQIHFWCFSLFIIFLSEEKQTLEEHNVESNLESEASKRVKNIDVIIFAADAI